MIDDLFRYLLGSLERVLTGSGLSAGEAGRLIHMVGAAEDTEAMTDLLLARVPKPAALIAVTDGFLYHAEAGLLLTPEESPTLEYVQNDVSTTDRVVECRVGDQRGWLYRHLDGLTVRVALGSRVVDGEFLTNGMLDVAEVLSFFGPRKAVAIAAERFATLCALELKDARKVAGPLCEAIEITEAGRGDDNDDESCLPKGSLCTQQLFRAEQQRWKTMMNAGLDVIPARGRHRHVAVDILAAMHDSGGCLSRPWLPARRRGLGHAGASAMTISHFDGVSEVSSMTELETVLAMRGRQGTANQFWMSHGDEDFPVLAVVVDSGLALVSYLTEEGHPGFISTGSPGDLDDPDGTYTFFITETERIYISGHRVIPEDSAMDAAREFAELARRPQCVEWFEL